MSDKKNLGKTAIIAIVLVVFAVATITTGVNVAFATSFQSPVNLASAGNYVILSRAGISTTGTTSIIGDIGVSPAAATYITGFSLILDSSGTFSTSSLVTGRVYAADYTSPTPATLTLAVFDMEAAFAEAASRTMPGEGSPDGTDLGGGQIGGRTISPGLYKWNTGVQISSDVTLDAQDNSGAVWIFQINGDLTVATGTKVILINGAQALNIFWAVSGGTGATIGTNAQFKGNILTNAAIHLNTGASITGRLLAETAVTLDSNTVSLQGPVIPEFPSFTSITIIAALSIATAAMIMFRRRKLVSYPRSRQH